MYMPSCLKILLSNVDVFTMCVCVNHCVSSVTVYDCMSPCITYTSVLMLVLKYVSVKIMLKLSRCVLPCLR